MQCLTVLYRRQTPHGMPFPASQNDMSPFQYHSQKIFNPVELRIQNTSFESKSWLKTLAFAYSSRKTVQVFPAVWGEPWGVNCSSAGLGTIITSVVCAEPRPPTTDVLRPWEMCVYRMLPKSPAWRFSLSPATGRPLRFVVKLIDDTVTYGCPQVPISYRVCFHGIFINSIQISHFICKIFSRYKRSLSLSLSLSLSPNDICEA